MGFDIIFGGVVVSLIVQLLKNVFVEYPLDMSVHEFVLGKKSFRGTPVEILYHEPKAEDNQHYVDVRFADGNITRIFRPSEIEFFVRVVDKWEF